MKSLPISWVDVLVCVIMAVGIFRGRKHGMSEELLPLLRTAAIVVVAGFFYKPVGKMVADSSVFSLLGCYLGAYIGLVIVIYTIFGLVKKSVGDKLLGSDLFGSSEYYLGIISSTLRYLGMVCIVFAVLHARAYTQKELDDNARMQQENFGDISFPTFATVQREVFAHSLTGRYADHFASMLLIEPTLPETKDLHARGANLRQDSIMNDVLGGSSK